MVEESCRIQLSYNNTYILNTGPITNIMQVSDFHSTLFRMLTTMAFIQVNATRIAKRVCNGGPSPVPRPKVLPEGRPILHFYNYTLTINNNYRTDHYCSRISYYYKNQSSTMQINYKTMQTRCPNLSSPITSKRIFMVFLVY